MKNMNDFKGSGGDWFLSGDKYPMIESKNTNVKILVTHPTIATINSTFISEEEYKANARLIASSKKLLKKVMEYRDRLEDEVCKNPDINSEDLDDINKLINEIL